jgi:cytoskeletal protein CcmA (bactofilin family)
MFRRKENEDSKTEGTAEPYHDMLTPPSNAAPGVGGQTSQGNALSGLTGTGAAQSGTASSFAATPAVPSTQPVVRTISDVTRNAPAASSAAANNSGYRPSPVTDFSRNAPRQDARSPLGHAALGGGNERHSVKTSPRILTVGNDILLKGEIATCDRVVIEGRVEAKLNEVHTVEIAACGSFKGTAEVEDAEISGLFEGDLAVKNRLVIYSTGEVRGNITYGEIEVERGGRLMGQIKTGSTHPAVVGHDKPNLLDVLDAKSRAGKDRDHKDAVA